MALVIRAGGHGYQTRINAILRRAMLEQLNAKRHRPDKPGGTQTG